MKGMLFRLSRLPFSLFTVFCCVRWAMCAESNSSSPAAAAGNSARPNIVYILCDDLGYGDVHALNPARGKIATPNFDKLATQGMTFTDAHSGSSVCTPTRYGILTGRYAWRTRLQLGVLQGMSPPLIADSQLTVASLLQKHGYATGAIGKWHLGLKFGDNQWTDPLKDGPLQHGFDYFFGISASLDMPPFVYIENDHVTEVPSVEKKWIRTGPAAKDFEAIDVLPKLTEKATKYIAAHAADIKRTAGDSKNTADAKPFFLYVAFTSPHTPIVPTPQWQGKSGLGPYGDFVMETDWAAGEVLKAIDTAGQADNTLVIFASDNGCSPAAKVDQLEAQGHYPSAQFRGYKADIWDGGHRIPFIVRWPGKVKPGSQTDALVCLTDLIATCADLVGEKLPANAAEDSQSLLSVLTGQTSLAGKGAADDVIHADIHEAVVHHSIDGNFAIRKGKWKLELCAGSGGWSAPREAAAVAQHLPPEQLYDMESDEGEKRNVATEHPEVVKELTALLTKYIADGRSTPGVAQKNDVPIKLRKEPKPAAEARKDGD
ncbi:MAG TPA: arylsulfatase [Pirellulales bacterium]|nr:arylsulfatase [Pirellulales bacterium]